MPAPRNADHLSCYPTDLPERARASREAKNSLRSLESKGDAERWGLYIGKDLPTFWLESERKRKSPEELTNTDRVLVEQTIKLVEAASPSDYPIILTNIGGMWDRDLIATAKYLNEQFGWIDDGTVALVSTNLAFTIPQGLRTLEENSDYHESSVSDKATLKFRLTSEEIEFIRQNHHLIHSIQSDAAELRTKHIIVPSKEGPKRLSLNGHIDLIIEANALMHSIKGDTDLYLLGKVMRPGQGILLLHSDRYDAKQGQGHVAERYTKLIRTGLKSLKAQGYAHLHDPNMLVNDPPNYHVFAADPGLAIDLDDIRFSS